jgi:hypothetical protein
MGAWGSGTFEDDDALDWLGELMETGKKRASTLVVKAMRKASTAKPQTYLELPDCSAAVVAAELVAAVHGQPAQDLPEEAVEWLESGALPSEPGLVELALQAVATVRAQGEAYELWKEAGEEPLREWQARLDALAERLRQCQASTTK